MKIKSLAVIALLAALAASGWYWSQHGAKAPSTSATVTTREPQPSARDSSVPTPEAAPAPATAAAPSADVAQGIALIVDEGADYRERSLAARNLQGNLTPADVKDLRSFLLKRQSADDEQMGQALKNTILDKLCEMNPPPDWLMDALTQIYRDTSHSEVLRDYAVQHAVSYYEQTERSAKEGRGSDPTALARTEALLWEAINETGNSIAGTALLGLARLSEGNPGFNQPKIRAAAVQLMKDPTAGELSRITAMQVSGRFRSTEVLPMLTQTAQSGDTMSLRISAVGAIGMMGGPDATKFLNTLADGEEERLRIPARRALKEISDREQQSAQINR